MSPLKDLSPGSIARFVNTQIRRNASRVEERPSVKSDDRSSDANVKLIGEESTSTRRNAAPSLVARRVSELDEERILYLWHDRIPLGMATILDGNPGVGKSLITIDIAARVSRGDILPDGTPSDLGGPSSVFLANTEDSAGAVIQRRYLSAGGDPNRLHLLGNVEWSHGGHIESERWSTPKRIAPLRERLLEHEAKLLVLDPAFDFMSDGFNSLNNADVRKAFGPLISLAEELNFALVLVRHVTKGAQPYAIQMGQGAMSMIARARSAHFVAADPSDETGTRMIFSHSKSNYGEKARSIAFRMVADDANECARLDWLGPADFTADQLLAAAPTQEERTLGHELVAYLLALTANGAVETGEAMKLARQEFGRNVDRSLRRARQAAGITHVLVPGYPPKHYWRQSGQSVPGLDMPTSSSESVRTERSDNSREILEVSAGPDDQYTVSGPSGEHLDSTSPVEHRE